MSSLCPSGFSGTFAAIALGIGLLAAGCGTRAGERRPGEACTRNEECLPGLVCSFGTCVASADGGPDAGDGSEGETSCDAAADCAIE